MIAWTAHAAGNRGRNGRTNAAPTIDHAARAVALPLDRIDASDPALCQHDVWQPYFARLRQEDPVHYVAASASGPYWAVTTYKDIIELEVNHAAFFPAGRRR